MVGLPVTQFANGQDLEPGPVPLRNNAGRIVQRRRGAPGPGQVALYTRNIRDLAGSSRILLGLAGELIRTGHQVEVFAERLAPGMVEDLGARPRYIVPPLLPRQLLRRLIRPTAWSRLATAAIHRRRPDLVIGNGDLLDQDVALVHNVVHREMEELDATADPRYQALQAWQERCLTRHGYRLLVTNSRQMMTEFSQRYSIPSDRMTVVHPGVDPALFSRRDRDSNRARVRAELGLSPATPLLGFITSGNLRLRNADAVAEVAGALAAGPVPGLRVLAVGNERNARSLTGLFNARGLGRLLIVRDKTPSPQHYFHAIDLLLHPARTEAYGLVVHEAAACGCPVVSSTRVGATELFQGQAREGFTAAPDPTLLVPLVAGLLDNPARLAALAEAQWRQAHHRSWETYTREFLEACAARGLV
jgi:UDP-glucose:(heptosyl)LPS alpha-1,3-glucosyltransferase